MNKQRYLAELRRLLVFMTDEDRDEAVRLCGAAFDAAGPEGETELIAAIGSPTKAAIGLSRGYEPGHIPVVFPAAPSAEPAGEAEPAPGAPSEVPLGEGEPFLPAEPEIRWTELPAFDLPGAEEPLSPAEPETGEPVPEEAGEEPSPLPEFVRDDPAEEPAGPVKVRERSMPLGLGIPLFVLVMAALGIPLAALCLGLALVLLCPGCAALTGAYLIFVGGLWCLSYMADAVLLFGLAFVALALGLLILWAGVWLAVKLIAVYVRGVRWLSGELLGRTVTVDE